MTIWAKIAIFETTAKTSVLGRWGMTPHLQYEKKIQKFARKVCFHQNLKNPFFWDLSFLAQNPIDVVAQLLQERATKIPSRLHRSLLPAMFICSQSCFYFFYIFRWCFFPLVNCRVENVQLLVIHLRTSRKILHSLRHGLLSSTIGCTIFAGYSLLVSV